MTFLKFRPKRHSVIFNFKLYEIAQKPVSFWVGEKYSNCRIVCYDDAKIQFPFSVQIRRYKKKKLYTFVIYDFHFNKILFQITKKYKNTFTKFQDEDIKKAKKIIEKRTFQILEKLYK